MVNNYVNIGYDIRKIQKIDSLISADVNIWDKDDFIYSKAKAIDGIEENFFQLLSPSNKAALYKLLELVRKYEKDAVLIMLSIEEDIFRTVKAEAPSVEPVTVDNIPINLIGVDICDIDGFFSIFDMRKDYFNREKLFEEKEIEDAKNILLKANELIPSHAPFNFVKLYKVRL
jgi:hypothetical protein